MTRRRFYVPRESIQKGSATLPPDQAHHLRDVLRLNSGDVVEIFDGAGAGYTGKVELIGSGVVIRDLAYVPSLHPESQLTLAAALIKPAKFEWVLEKSTELGVGEIIPLKTRFCDIRIPEDRIESRLDRWNRILTEASRQSRRFDAPRLQKPQDFDAFIAGVSPGSDKILLYERASEIWQPAGLHSGHVVLCVGPEGGWDDEEIEKAGKAGFQICGLGPLILRAETASIAAVAIVQHHSLRNP